MKMVAIKDVKEGMRIFWQNSTFIVKAIFEDRVVLQSWNGQIQSHSKDDRQVQILYEN